MNAVEAITGTFALDDEERDHVTTILAQVEQLQTALGAERERHHLARRQLEAALRAEDARGARTEAGLLDELAAARSQYTSLIDVLAKKHVKRPGKFDFRPELGAFVEARAEGKNA